MSVSGAVSIIPIYGGFIVGMMSGLENKKSSQVLAIIGREERIRTSGPGAPNAVLYQAELLPDPFAFPRAKDLLCGSYASPICGSSHSQRVLQKLRPGREPTGFG